MASLNTLDRSVRDFRGLQGDRLIERGLSVDPESIRSHLRRAQREAELNELRAIVEDGLGGLSDDELLLRVGQYMRQLDTEVKAKLDGMRARAADGRVLAAIAAEITRQANAVRPEDRERTELDLSRPVTYTDANGFEQTATLGQLLERYRIPADNVRLGGDALSGVRAAITALNEDLRAQGESSQIELQQIMSRRSQMLQITSNIMASRNDSRKAIAQNIRG
jgi:hypothetical protein